MPENEKGNKFIVKFVLSVFFVWYTGAKGEKAYA